ncbi:LOW QUALITY PROTEIN: nectin-2 [Rhinatrema bivittatum]|uniref:LOW QUALITY PROTEIN: nectin-2 n=1 Tax=Rhinatrema bivittatum TaxID=194408 RepID=UPI00112BC19C|nr:LOW QUALITY PROTEIN: nectin-2 [Rhinatrema bivittatum]
MCAGFVSRSGAWALLLLLCVLLRAVHGQRVKVREEVLGYVGQQVVLPCVFSPGADFYQVSQVTWVKNTNGKKVSIAVYHPEHGASYPSEGVSGRFVFQKPTLQDATLTIKSLKMSDEGAYTCEFATYPNGNEEAETKVIVLAEPQNSAQAVPVIANETESTVATCISANGRPPSEITWQSSLSGNVTTTQSNNTDGTITVTSQFKTVPTSQADGKMVTCVIKHKASKEPVSIPVVLSVQYPPEVTIEGYDNNWYISRSQADLKCTAKGNPSPTSFEWTSSNGSLPDTVEVINNLLVVKPVDHRVNITFICKVSNAVGTNFRQLSVLIRGSPDTSGAGTTGGIIGGIIATIVVIAVMVTVVLICKQQRKNQNARNDLEDPPAYKPPPPKQKLQPTEGTKSVDNETEEVLLKPSSKVETSSGGPLKYQELAMTDNAMDLQHVPIPSTEDDYLEQINPIYNELSYPTAGSYQDQGFVMSKAMYV